MKINDHETNAAIREKVRQWFEQRIAEEQEKIRILEQYLRDVKQARTPEELTHLEAQIAAAKAESEAGE